MRKTVLVAALMAGTFLPAVPAHAAFADFMAATCGANCADPIGERSSAEQNWQALQDMGTTQFIGSQLDGRTIDVSSLLAAARVIGTTELDRWLRTGNISSGFSLDKVTEALGVTGIDMGLRGADVSRVLGGMSGIPGADVSNVIASSWELPGLPTTGGGFADVGTGGAYCDQAVDSIINASAQAYVNSVVEAAESDMGFSQVGGMSPNADSHSESGLFGGSCLDIFMTGDKDTLFKPPQLGQLVSMMSQMFGAEAQGSCAGAPTVHEQVAGSFPMGAFSPGNGGFFPGMEYSGGESTPSLHKGNNYGLPNAAPPSTRSSGFAGLL
jgi:hypothetical protein